MKSFLLYMLLGFIALPVLGQTPRTALTGVVIDGAHANQPIGVVVTPNPQIWLSDELVQDKELKWREWTPVTVWRQRKIAGEFRLCPVTTFQVEVDKNGRAEDLKPQMFVIPAELVREFDHFSFEYRPWYSITTTISSPTGSILVPADLGSLHAAGELRIPINCSEPSRSQHVRLFKE